jgi:hypothetical protein
MENVSILELTNKEQIASFVTKKVNECLMGELNPLTLKIQVAMIGKALDQINDATKEMQLLEAQKYGAKSFEYQGAKIEISELGTKYNYSVCNDSEINDLNKELEILKSKIKDRESFLKGIKEKLDIVVNGEEVVTLYPPLKTSTTGLKCTLK